MSGQTFAQKALARAAGLPEVAVGQLVDARPDRVLSHDNTAAIRSIWKRLGQARVAIPERLAITLDHAVPAPTPRHAENHAVIRRFVREQGIDAFFEVGRGICHQVLSEEALVLPGQLVVGADSHTPHFGWMGAFGAGIGRSEVAALWATGELWMQVPETLRIDLHGTLSTWVSAKDVALHLIGRLGQDGALYRAVEFGGPAVASLDLSDRATLANMMAEMGAKCSWIAPDDATFAYLNAALRHRLGGSALEQALDGLHRNALYPDADAPYVQHLEIDAATVQPQVACPHRVDHTVACDALEAERIAVQQAFLGTCTNGRLEDLEVVHRLLRGRRVAPETRLLVVPASSRVLSEAIQRGWVGDLMASGAVFGTPGCGPCMGNHMGVLAPGETCISSANRNFRGRMGTTDADIYLASPAVVAASALRGYIASPNHLEEIAPC